MKKFFVFAAAAMMSVAAFANLKVNNPVNEEDGLYIVKWDCAADDWAKSNDFEVDETFTFAVDITGTPFEEYIKQDCGVEGARRMLAFNKWTDFGGLNGDAVRLKQIKGNIYGATFNLYQEGADLEVKAAMTEAGAQTSVKGQIFCFLGNDEISNAGGWWLWPEGLNPEKSYVSTVEGDETTQAEQIFFKTLPYTGEKTSEEFINGDYEGMWEVEFATVPGYAAACVEEGQGINNATVEVKAVKVVENGQLYLISNGVRYNVLGAEMK